MQIKRRYLILGLLPVFAVGALATGFNPLQWQLFERQAAPDTQKVTLAKQPSSTAKAPAKAAAPAAKQMAALKKPLPASTATAPASSPATAARQPASAVSPTAKNTPASGIDVARINLDGASVIAGHAKPSSRITVMADGKPVGAITSDASGDWVLVTMHKFGNPNAKLTIKSGDHTTKKVAALVTPGTSSDVGKAPAPRRTAAQVTRQMMQRLETLTREASEKEQTSSSQPSSSAPVAATPSSNGTPSKAASAPSAVTSKEVQKPVANEIVKPASPSAPATKPDMSVAKVAKVVESGSSNTPTPSASAAPRPVVVASAAPAKPQKPEPQASPAKIVQPAPASEVKPQIKAKIEKDNQSSSPAKVSTGSSETSTRVAVITAPTAAAASPAAPQNPDRPAVIKAAVEPLPVPVQFIYRKDIFTENGRQAAALLLKYFLAKKFKNVTLSGHADERGTTAANRKLSRERLQRIEKFLRNGGFTGKLKLVPKGETEVYTGVDRTKFPQEELWQLDRRVEVVAAK